MGSADKQGTHCSKVSIKTADLSHRQTLTDKMHTPLRTAARNSVDDCLLFRKAGVLFVGYESVPVLGELV